MNSDQSPVINLLVHRLQAGELQ